MKSILKKIVISLALISALPFCANAQRSEMGFLAGVSTYKGELNPTLLDTRFFSPAVGMFFRYNASRRVALKANFSYGYIFGDDAKSSDDFAKNRNLSFQSSLLDVSGHLEFNFLPYEIGNRKYPFTPYVLVGIGIFHFDPRASYTDPVTGDTRQQQLQPLGTEGQGTTQFPDRKEYALTQVCVPFGGGIKLNVGQMGIGFEMAARKIFTDYLDDVSTTYVDHTALKSQNGDVAATMADKSIKQDTKAGSLRGNSEDTDWYLFAGLTIYFRLDRKPDGCDSFHMRSNYIMKPDR